MHTIVGNLAFRAVDQPHLDAASWTTCGHWAHVQIVAPGHTDIASASLLRKAKIFRAQLLATTLGSASVRRYVACTDTQQRSLRILDFVLVSGSWRTASVCGDIRTLEL